MYFLPGTLHTSSHRIRFLWPSMFLLLLSNLLFFFPSPVTGQRHIGHLQPFFFLCNYHGPSQNYGLDSGQVVLSVNIEGNPSGYKPDTFYNISISSSETFDSLLMTGLYTTTSSQPPSPAVLQSGSATQRAHDVMCSIIHSQVSPRPMKKLSFTWMAPPTGTGCVNFLATATHGQQLLLKDTSIAQLCEEGALSSTAMQPELAEVNSDSVLIRDDFDSGSDFNPDLWTTVEGGHVGDECGPLVNGKSAIFCDSIGSREMASAPLNLTSAHVLQFFLGGGECRKDTKPDQDQDIVVAYGTNGCSEWIPIQPIKAPTGSKPEIHLVTLPLKARQVGICIMFFQPSNVPGGQTLFIKPIEAHPTAETSTETTGEESDATQTKSATAKTVDETTESTPGATTDETTVRERTAKETLSTATAAAATSSATTEAITAETTAGPMTSPETSTATRTASTATPMSSSTTLTATPMSTSTTLTATAMSTGTTLTATSQESTTVETSPATTDATAADESTTGTSQTELSELRNTDKAVDPQPGGLPLFMPNDGPYADEPVQFLVPYHGCWSIDNVIVVNTADPPRKLHEDFDPIDLSDWIFFPGAHVDHKCQSHGNTFIFSDRNQTVTYATTRDLDLDAENVAANAFLLETFETKNTKLNTEGGHVSSACGTIHQGNALTFDGPKERSVCTHSFDISDADSVRFYLKFGGATSCQASRQSPSVLMYLEDEESHTLVLDKLEAHFFLAKSHGGHGADVWSVDDLALLPLLPARSRSDAPKVFQASLNLNCQNGGGESKSPSISVEYSTDHGASWHEFYSPCLPSICPNGDYSSLSSYLTGKDFYGWDRLTLPIPYSAQSPHTRFRVMQYHSPAGQWAMDDVFIGSCPLRCNGHGMCTEKGCSCDYGYDGPTCERPTSPAPSNMQETFEDPLVISTSSLLDIIGGSVGYLCGVIASGKALVFNQAGRRSLTTTEVNLTSVSHVQFTMRVGSQSAKSSCQPPDAPWESVLLEVSCDGGITWALLGQYATAEYNRPMSVSTPLPVSTRGLCRFRWRQPQHSGQGKDVWAIDDILLVSLQDSGLNPDKGGVPEFPIGGGGMTSLAVEMMNSAHLDSRLTTNLGELEDSFCGRMRSLHFSSPERNGEPRALKTKAIRVGPGYIAQFDLVMGCGVPYADHLDNQIYFQYSIDHGISWHLVEDVCLPPDLCSFYTGGSIYHHSKFDAWQTVTVILPPDTLSQQTKFQWIQPDWSETDVWAVSRVYIGHPCPELCHGHGVCHLGVCRCKEKFSGDSCTPDFQMDSSIQADFGHRYDPTLDFAITGGDVVRADQGCGIILSGESLLFAKDGVRELLTKDLNTEQADFLQMWIQVGGKGGSSSTGDGGECSGADRRSEAVLVRFSNDGGISWSLLAELDHRKHQTPTFVHLPLPKAARSKHTRFQWWQPEHSGPGTDQWAVDGIMVESYGNLDTLEDNFNTYLNPIQSGAWRVITEGAAGKYCGRTQPSLVMSNQVNDKFAVTQDVTLRPGDVLQFEINVNCGKLFRWDHPVILQYSHDNGHTWSLVEDPCYLDQNCNGKLTEGSIYYTGTHGQWSLVVIPISDKIAMHPAIIRWWQPGGVDHSFGLDNVHIGAPCPNNCHRRGVCQEGVCHCLDIQEDGSEVIGPDCAPTGETPQGMLDRFDNQNMPLMEFWHRVRAGNLGRGCGPVDFGGSLYFGGDGTREAQTLQLNATEKSILEVSIKIGDQRHSASCRPPNTRDEAVIIDFSTNNGVTWSVLKVVEPSFEDVRPATVLVDLPLEAKTERTIFRFWQPLGHGGMPRAEWAIDSVLVGVNDTSRAGFQDKFSGMLPNPHNWFLADAASNRQTCGSSDSALEFSHKNGYHIAETWDYKVSHDTFLQFNLAMNCGALASPDVYDVILEYSVDHGQSWQPVVTECKPPSFECPGYHLSSAYPSAYYGNWTRVTVALPEGAISPKTRFRWLRPGTKEPSPIWAIDNVYLGSDCPWLCSGHGVCREGKCYCDKGFGGEFCVADVAFPSTVNDDFNSAKTKLAVWGEVYGGSNSLLCGSLVTDKSLHFEKSGLRMAVTHDMDSTLVTHIEFHFRYGCGDKATAWPREHSVLLQYSTTGGILWKLIRELHFSNTSQPVFYSIPLPPGAKHNATRFRFWQASSAGELGSVWAIDNLHIGPMSVRPPSVLDIFQANVPQSDQPGDPMAWTFVNNGQINEFCDSQRRSDQTLPMGDNSALVFRRYHEGEISAVTTDLDLGPMSVLQFDINVGCGTAPRARYPVRLEYSADGGSSWHLVGPDCVQEAFLAHRTLSVASSCFESKLPSTVYYAGESNFWRRVVVPLDHIRVCGPVRFRWYQGKIPDTDFGPEWALDNVYIGMACMHHCNGHGFCLAGMMCQCDRGYKGPLCVPEDPLPGFLKEDFDTPPPAPAIVGSFFDLQRTASGTSHGMDESNWHLWSSGETTNGHRCGNVFTGSNFVQDTKGHRALTTVPLDLSIANSIQFHMRLGCNETVERNTPPVYLQYSNNGGIYWTTIQQFEFSADQKSSRYIAVHLPRGSLSNATQIRWFQPSENGHHREAWAIDQIFIGGNINGELFLQDDWKIPLNTTWVEQPGARLDYVCGSDELAWHFTKQEKERYATTADVKVVEGSFLQFDLAMGCEETRARGRPCFDLSLQYSLDLGTNWQLLFPACLPSMPECARYHQDSVYTSDSYTGWTAVTVPIPQHAWSSQTRFRLYQAPEYSADQSWAVRRLYVGWQCPTFCQGHGHCHNLQCVCDAGWSGDDCSQSDAPLPNMLVEDFLSKFDSSHWARVVGGAVVQPCRVVASGEAMHFTGSCSRLLETGVLDLTSNTHIQFYFLYGCDAPPSRRDEGVLVEYSTDGGVTWTHLTEMHFNLYRTSTFVSLLIPESAKSQAGTKIRWRQPQHDGANTADWLVDNIRVNGDPINPSFVAVNFTSGLEYETMVTTNGIKVGDYCGREAVAVGRTPSQEASTLISREVTVTDKHAMHFSINVGCGESWDAKVLPVDLAFSTDHGVTWTDLVSTCESQASCAPFSSIAQAHHHGTHDNWRRITIPLKGLPVSNGTRFRWQQKPNGMPEGQDWAIGDIYIGLPCPQHCTGRGQCFLQACHCDDGLEGDACELAAPEEVKDTVKDTFDQSKEVEPSKWPWVQGGQIQWPPCGTLVSERAMVMNGPGAREMTTSSLDLRDARFIQYTAGMWSQEAMSKVCKDPPKGRSQRVLLQISGNGGVTWTTLHVLSPERYNPARRDYIPIPLHAKTENSLVRWVQAALPDDSFGSPRVHWALDDVFVGGKEINPAEYVQNFNGNKDVNYDTRDGFGNKDDRGKSLQDDPNAWEFSPYGVLGFAENPCGVSGSEEGSAMVWMDISDTSVGGQYGTVSGERLSDAESASEALIQKFTSNQLIVQAGYMLQFKLTMGCGQYQDACSVPDTQVRLEYRRDPSSDLWSNVQASCLPGTQGMEGLCNPHKHHHPSHYRLSEASVWTRITILLNEVTYSSTTQFRWIQDGSNGTVMWGLDDIYIGEKCPELCRGRGDCVLGVCECDQGYMGPSCSPPARSLRSRLFDSFEGGVSPSHWSYVRGGGLGFGCGALLPFAHGKTLYFNGCGSREAVTVEMDTSHAIKIIFVIQLGCYAQTHTCNIELSEGPDYRGVLLQYSTNKGADWYFIAQHDPADFLRPRKVAYDIPASAKQLGTQFRWWQPTHGGHGFDQWAIDHVEIISGRRRNSRRGWRRRG